VSNRTCQQKFRSIARRLNWIQKCLNNETWGEDFRSVWTAAQRFDEELSKYYGPKIANEISSEEYNK
jgi:hypothetical protein